MTQLTSSSPAKECARPGLHNRVLRIVELWPRGRTLDAGAGEGALSEKLHQLGFEVVALDKDPTRFKLRDVPVIGGDLSGEIPIESASFDYIICLEVLEHIENPFLMMREFSRLIRPGGRLLISTPNILNLRSRVGFLLRGFHSNFSPLVMGIDTNPAHTPYPLHPFDHHINPTSLLEIKLMLNRTGMDLHAVYTADANVRRPVSRLYRIIARGLIRLTNRRAWAWHFVDPSLSELLIRDEVLRGQTLIVEAGKPE